jgi:RimJ/RimL family protein N-acetyltransferase
LSVLLPIECERLLVRPFVPEADNQSMLAAYGDPEVMRFIPGGPLRDLAAVTSLLESYATAQRAHGFSSWAVVERESGCVIGDVGLGIFEPTGEIELGYTLARRYWGRGYASEAASACLAAGLAQLAPARIIVVVDEANEASLRVAGRIGMTEVERIVVHGRPHVLFAADGGRAAGGRVRAVEEATSADAASANITQRIQELGDWRGETLARVRQLIHDADPDIEEEWKWAKATSPGTPVWSHDGGVCTGESYKEVVKLTFFRGASIKDPKKLFNSSLQGNTRRAIDLREGDELDETAFKQLIRAAVAANSAARAERAAKKK